MTETAAALQDEKLPFDNPPNHCLITLALFRFNT